MFFVSGFEQPHRQHWTKFGILCLLMGACLSVVVAADDNTVRELSSGKAKGQAKEGSEGRPFWEPIRAKRVMIRVDDTVVRESLPNTLFGFNINYVAFQDQLWDANTQSVKPGIVANLRPFSGAIYRYPGGLLANGFDWSQAVGSPAKRQVQQPTSISRPPLKVMFGINEYLELLSQLNGQGWYVLNLVGLNGLQPMMEYDQGVVAESNRALARHLWENSPRNISVHHYELGNELDRSRYEWSHEKYVARSLATITAIRDVDKDARFIAFLRDFRLKYKKNPERPEDMPANFLADVMRGLPMVEDFSLHHYYDGRRGDGTDRTIPYWLERMSQAIESFRSVRNGKAPQVWITEHARQRNKKKRSVELESSNSNLSSAISTADYLIALAQFPEVKGAVWHGLNTRRWQVFDATLKHRDLRPLPIYWGLRVLRTISLPIVLATRTYSTNISGYRGGYDVRGVAFRDSTGDALGLWIVNRAPQVVNAELEYLPFRGEEVVVWHAYLAGTSGTDPEAPDLEPARMLEPRNVKGRFSEDGKNLLDLPPASVSTIIFRKK